MYSVKNSYDYNNQSQSLPFTGIYENLSDYTSIYIYAKTIKNDTLYIEFTNDSNDTGYEIQESYNINNSEKEITLTKKLKYFRIRIDSINQFYNTDQRLYNIILLSNTQSTNKLKFDSSGNLLVAGISGGGTSSDVNVTNSSLKVENVSGNELNVNLYAEGAELNVTNVGLKNCLDVFVKNNEVSVNVTNDELVNITVDTSAIKNKIDTTNSTLTTISNELTTGTLDVNVTNNPSTYKIILPTSTIQSVILNQASWTSGSSSTIVDITNYTDSTLSYEDTSITNTDSIIIYASPDSGTNYYYIGRIIPIYQSSGIVLKRYAVYNLKLAPYTNLYCYNDSSQTISNVKINLASQGLS